MKVAYTDRAQQTADFKLLQETTRRLEDVLGTAAPLASAQWDSTTDERGRAVYLLDLSDFTGKVTGKFAPDELRSTALTNFRLHRLFGDLLHVRNQQQLEKLSGMGA